MTPCSTPTPQVRRFPFYFIPSLSTLYSVPLLGIVMLNVRILQVVHSVSLFTPARLLQPVWNMNNKQRSVSIGVLSTLGIRPLHPQGFIQDFELGGGGGTGWYQDDKLFNTCEVSGGGRENFRPPPVWNPASPFSSCEGLVPCSFFSPCPLNQFSVVLQAMENYWVGGGDK